MVDPSADERLDRLKTIELQLDKLFAEVGRLREALGRNNTSLLFDLDQRYLTIREAEVLYIPRREHEQRDQHHQEEQLKQRGLRWQIPIVVMMGIQTIAQWAVILHR